MELCRAEVPRERDEILFLHFKTDFAYLHYKLSKPDRIVSPKSELVATWLGRLFFGMNASVSNFVFIGEQSAFRGCVGRGASLGDACGLALGRKVVEALAGASHSRSDTGDARSCSALDTRTSLRAARMRPSGLGPAVLLVLSTSLVLQVSLFQRSAREPAPPRRVRRSETFFAKLFAVLSDEF